ncbi:MAG: LysR family transcriptional regulator [Proteobacteria bacterium]|nr:LysR family transcriptional regulator [Pseudomonadota bacterium]
MRKTDGAMPELTDLRAFVLAAEQGSLTGAAAAEGVAQSAFSRQLARLEGALGGRLLHRTGRGVSLSELGERVLPRAKELVAQARLLADDAAGRWSRPAGVVEVGLLPSVTNPLAGLLFAAVREAFPDIRLRLHEAYSGEIQTLLADGRIDVGTLNRYRPLRREPHDAVLTSPMSLIVRAEAPASRGGRSVTFAAAAALPLVMPLKPNGLRGVVEEIAARRRLVLTVALEVGSSTAMKDAVRCGLAATLPAHAVRDETARGEFRALLITHPTIRQTTFVETTRRRPASAAVREVERLLRKLVPTLGPP